MSAFDCSNNCDGIINNCLLNERYRKVLITSFSRKCLAVQNQEHESCFPFVPLVDIVDRAITFVGMYYTTMEFCIFC